MERTRRRKAWFISGAAVTALVVILWATYLFTTIWLRACCARELAENVEPLRELRPADRVHSQVAGPSIFAGYSTADLVFSDLWRGPLNDSLDRLKALQRPTVVTVLRQLLGKSSSSRVAEDDVLSGTNRLISRVQVLADSAPATSTGIQVDDDDGAAQEDLGAAFTTTGQSFKLYPISCSTSDTHCYSVTDSHGETVLVVTQSIPSQDNDEQATDSWPALEILVVDSAGRILQRSRILAGNILGKLAQKQGKADQLVCGVERLLAQQDGSLSTEVVGPGAVFIVEDGRLKSVPSIDAPELADLQAIPSRHHHN
jgi:hypothetical protein